jgi:glycerophosphoryl diester phosphodiesterase
MIVLAHRGFWNRPEEQNSLQSFERSFEHGFGVETDIRDRMGELVISHDMAREDSLSAVEFFELYSRIGRGVPLALNIKADGLQSALAELLQRFSVRNYFVFDASIPDSLKYVKMGLRFFTRQSEYEPVPALIDSAAGVWMDEFKAHWIENGHIEGHLATGKQVCVVSPELHKRSHEREWRHYRELSSIESGSNMMICTDFPVQAKEFFNVL